MRDAIEGPIVVVDLSLVLDLLVGLPTHSVGVQWRKWEETGFQVAAPSLIGFEVTNALFQQERRRLLSAGTVDDCLARFLEIRLVLFEPGPMAMRALELARFFG